MTVWPAEEHGKSVVTAEYTGTNPDLVMRNVLVSIPCFSKDAPNVSHIDGDYTFDPRENMFTWHVDEISAEASGSLEFSIQEVPQDKFFPVHVSFSSETLFSAVSVDSVTQADSAAAVDFSSESMIVVEEYTIA